MSQLHLSHHPLVLHRLAILRDAATPPLLFRRMVRDIAQMLFLEAAQDLKVEPHTVTTPLAPCEGKRLAERIGLAPILRAGLGMAEAILELVPEAQVWHLGLYRDHRTMKPITYYNKLSGQAGLDVCYVVDPMLATGGSASAAIALLKDWGLKRIRFVGLIAAPEGIEALGAAHPDVTIHLAALDSRLNENCFIVPGLGDAGDRQFGTETE
ncbi:MAG: uracil phosphoribosyltransferase [Gemmataceae bacterium]|nr:uracil phosphoribosyltransferase [Gemmataceae bacterium]